MNFSLDERQQALVDAAKAFAAQISPQAGEYDKQQKLPLEVVKQMAEAGLLGCMTPKQYGGSEYDLVSFGLVNEAIGKACSSVRSLITVHSMVQQALAKWGNENQKQSWLPELASGSKIGAFALSEPDVGSDAASVKAEFVKDGQEYVLNGTKRWITFGQIADVFLVVGQVNGKPLACLVDANTPGLSVTPIEGMMGCRASMLAELNFDNCRIRKVNVLGGAGFGFSAIALAALEIGRYSVASGSVGIAQACLDVCTQYVKEREQFGQPLKDFQLIRRHLTDMRTQTKAAQMLYLHGAWLKEQDDPSAGKEIMRAKYYAGKVANDVARSAVQILGAKGYSDAYPLERYFRDAKAMEIIEGSNEVLQLVLGSGE